MGDEIERRLVRKSLNDALRVNAMMMKKDAQDYTIAKLIRVDAPARRKWLESIFDVARRQSLKENLLSLADMENIMSQVVTTRSDRAAALFKAYDVPDFIDIEYSTATKIMQKPERRGQDSGDVRRMTDAYVQRFLFVQQRISRLTAFAGIKFQKIEDLLSISHPVEHTVVLAMLTQQKADTWHLEDLTGTVQVEFAPDCAYHEGLFSEGCVMIFEGTYQSLLFTATSVGLVPAERAEETRKAYGNANWFAGDEKLCFRSSNKLRVMAQYHGKEYIIALSDFHLDNPKVLTAFRKILDGYRYQPPIAYILCGNFSSQCRQPQTMEVLHRGFRHLASVLEEFEADHAETHFIFVPGPDDPPTQCVTPRLSLPSELCDEYLQRWPKCQFVGNPARVQLANSEIVVYREDVIEKLCRHAVNVPATEQELAKAAVQTVLSQAHLCPVPIHVSPVIWNLDHALRMPALPDTLIIADKFQPFHESSKECNVVNPGPFWATPHSFMLIRPYQREVEHSELGQLITEPNDFSQTMHATSNSTQNAGVSPWPRRPAKMQRLVMVVLCSALFAQIAQANLSIGRLVLLNGPRRAERSLTGNQMGIPEVAKRAQSQQSEAWPICSTSMERIATLRAQLSRLEAELAAELEAARRCSLHQF
ncbi:unnamed protein product, partial [Mesorhabditis spiculigera]